MFTFFIIRTTKVKILFIYFFFFFEFSNVHIFKFSNFPPFDHVDFFFTYDILSYREDTEKEEILKTFIIEFFHAHVFEISLFDRVNNFSFYYLFYNIISLRKIKYLNSTILYHKIIRNSVTKYFVK